MKKIYNFKTSMKLSFTCFLMVVAAIMQAQPIVTTYTNNNGSGAVTFNFQNANAYDVLITDIASITGVNGANTAQFWYKPTPIAGPPGAISVPNGWTMISSQAFTGVANTTTTTSQPFLTGLSFNVPAGTTYAFAVACNSLRYSTLPAGPATVSSGGCTFISGTNVGYGGTLAAPTNTPRGFIGSINFMPAVPCSGTPNPGNTVSSANPVCPSVNFTLSPQNPVGGTGTTYQWQSSPDGIIYTNIGGATSSNYLTSQTVATYYQLIVTCTISGMADTSTALLVNMNGFMGCYCSSMPTNTADEEIFNVTVGTLNNTTSCASVGTGPGSLAMRYANYMSGAGAPAAPNVTQVTATPFSVQVNTCGATNFNSGLAIFIDLNQNGLFTDVGEKVYSNGATANITCVPATTINSTFTIPVTALLGVTAMRVVDAEGISGDAIVPCNTTFGYGEVEDYLINIVAAVPCSGTPSAGVTTTTANPVCPTTSFTLGMSTPPSGATGITYQWQSSPDGVVYTNIGGATNSTYTTTQSDTTFFQVIVTCTVSGMSDTTTAIQMNMNSFMGCYCASGATVAADEEILGVTVSTLNNTSTCATTGGPGSILNRYSNYTTLVPAPTLIKTSNYPFTINIGTCGGNFASGTAIFIDYNQNGSFADAGEQVYTTPVTTNGPHLVTNSFTVPAGALTGVTGMRVINAEGFSGAAITPCLSYGYGETEDYIVNIANLPPNPPTPTQDPTPPTCASGTQLTVPGSPASGDAWYWQTSPTGTSTATPVSGPYTVFVNGTYYVRTYNATSGVWSSGSSSVTVSNIPVSPTPPAPTAGANPACTSTTISVTPAPAGTAYFWQGTTAGGTSSAMNASTPYSVTATGTYYLAGYDSASTCWSNTSSVSVTIDTYIPAAPTTPTNAVVCQGATSAMISSVVGGSGTQTVSFGTSLISVGSTPTTVNMTIPALPAGATVTGTQLFIQDATALGASYQSEIRIALTGAITLAPTQISLINGAGTVTPNPYIITTALAPVGGGPITLSITETFDDGGTDATFTEIHLTITYTLPPSTINWWDAATAGVAQGTGSPFESVGTLYLPNTSAPGTYTFYAEATSGACPSATRLPVTVTVNPLPLMTMMDTAVCTSTGSHVLDAQNAGDTYIWNTAETTQTITVSTNGLYFVDITTPAGCAARDSVNVMLNAPPAVALGPDAAFCAGDSITIDAGNTGFTFLWSTSATTQTINASTTGAYSVAVTNPSTMCVGYDTTMITANPLPVVDLGVDTAICVGDSLVLDAGNAGATYSWQDASTGQMFNANTAGTYTVLVTDPMTTCFNADTMSLAINALPVVDLGADTAICSGSPLTLDAGNVGSTYIWQDSTTMQTLVVMTASMYGVQVTDANGCKQMDTISVSVNALPMVSIGPDSTQCGGTIVLDAGNPSATYVWSDATMMQTLGVTSSGNYSVAVTDTNGCVQSDTAMITINMVPVVAFGPDVTQCGDSITLDAGNPGLSYLWTNSTTNQTLTTYTSGTFGVTVTDTLTGCNSGDSINITINPVPSLNLGADTTQCGGSITLDAGAGATSYAWTGGPLTQTYVVSASGTYDVTISNGLCNAMDTIMVTINPLPVVGLTPFTTPICLQAPAFTLTNGTPAGGVYSGTGVSAGMFDPAVAGVGVFSIMYAVTDVNSCQNSTSQNITVQDCTGIEEFLFGQDINVYPNPTSGMFSITMLNANFAELSINITDIEGKVVYSEVDNNITADYNKQINLEQFAKGIYYIRLSNGTEMTVRKLIIQ